MPLFVAQLVIILPLQVEVALHHAMREARKRDESMHEGIDFRDFLTMLRSDSRDSLDQVCYHV